MSITRAWKLTLHLLMWSKNSSTLSTSVNKLVACGIQLALTAHHISSPWRAYNTFKKLINSYQVNRLILAPIYELLSKLNNIGKFCWWRAGKLCSSPCYSQEILCKCHQVAVSYLRWRPLSSTSRTFRPLSSAPFNLVITFFMSPSVANSATLQRTKIS